MEMGKEREGVAEVSPRAASAEGPLPELEVRIKRGKQRLFGAVDGCTVRMGVCTVLPSVLMRGIYDINIDHANTHIDDDSTSSAERDLEWRTDRFSKGSKLPRVSVRKNWAAWTRLSQVEWIAAPSGVPRCLRR